MELELKMDRLNGYDTVLDTTILHEETQESIVPDACPDILRIVDTRAMVCLKSKDAQEGRVELSGIIRAAVLYCPEGGGGLRRMSVTLPFRCKAEAAGVTGRCRVVVCARVCGSDGRCLNPRKVLTRVNLILELRVFAPRTEPICAAAVAPPECGLQQQNQTHNASVITCVEEKPFTFSDDLTLERSKPAIEELLKTRVELQCSESKIIGNKLILKGQANVQLFYRDASAALTTADFELPFSQIMEVNGVEEDAECTLHMLLTGCECTPAEGGPEPGRVVSLTLAMLAQATVREERHITLLSDAYSTLYDLIAQRSPYTFYRREDKVERRVNLREVLETTDPVSTVSDISVSLGAVTQSREGNTLTLRVESAVTVLYLDENGAPGAVTRPLPASCQLELPEGCRCACSCRSRGECFALPTAAGVEVRYPIDFFCLALLPQPATGISDLRLASDTPKNTADRPSIVLRLVGEGEQLWDLAKAYSATTEDIIQANALSEETPAVGTLLLIPKKR